MEFLCVCFFLSKVMKKLSMEPPDRLTSLQALWESNKPAEPGPCGRKFDSVLLHPIAKMTCVCVYLSKDTLNVSLSRWVFSDVQMCV